MNTNEVINITNEPISNEKKKNKAFPIIIGILLVIAVIIGLMSLINEKNKEKGQTFVNYLLREQSVIEIFEKDELITSNVQTKCTLDSENSSGEKETIYVDVTNQNGVIDGVATIGDEKDVFLEFIKEGNTIAINSPDLYEKFIAISSENGIKLGKKFGYDFSGLENNEATAETLEFLKNILERYENAIASSAGKYVKISENDRITIDENTYEVTKYQLNIDIKAFFSIYKTVLKELKDDEEGLTLIATFMANGTDQTFDDAYLELKNTIQTQYLTFSLVGLIDESENTDILDLNLYVLDGKTIKTEVILKDPETTVEFAVEALSKENEKYIKFFVKANQEEFAAKYDSQKSGNINNGKIVFYDETKEISKIKFVAEKQESITRNARKIAEVNNILLNTASDKELDEVCQKVFGQSLDEFALSNLEDEEKMELISLAQTVSSRLKLDMKKETAMLILADYELEIREETTESICYEKNGIRVISLYFEDEKIKAIYNHVLGSTTL